MNAKVGIYMVGAWPGQVEKLEEQLRGFNVLVGRYSGEETLLQHAKKGMLTHLLVSHESALNQSTAQKLKELNIQVLNFRDTERIF
jgi:hypothetical protein